MTSIVVLNQRQALSSPLPKVIRVKVDRSSALGNPFKMTSPDSRALVVSQYRVWLRKQLTSRTPASAAFNQLLKLAQYNDLELVCWCTPLECHADVIRDFLVEKLNEIYAARVK
jgi:hypothetical protein